MSPRHHLASANLHAQPLIKAKEMRLLIERLLSSLFALDFSNSAPLRPANSPPYLFASPYLFPSLSIYLSIGLQQTYGHALIFKTRRIPGTECNFTPAEKECWTLIFRIFVK